MAAATKDTIAIPATGGKPLTPQCGALQPAETKFLKYIGVKDPALILINAG